MLEDLYVNENDQEIRNMVVDVSMTSMFGITGEIRVQLESGNGPVFIIRKMQLKFGLL